MDLTNVSEFLRAIRARKRLSQNQLAKQLGVTQATISRIESGKLPEKLSREFVSKLEMLERGIKSKETSRKPVIFELNGNGPGDIVYTVNKMGWLETGDVASVINISKNKSMLIMGDVTGNGPEVAHQSSSIQFGFQAIIGLISESVLSSSLVENALFNAMEANREIWVDDPGVLIASINPSGFEFTARGIPQPMIYSKGRVGSPKTTFASNPKPEDHGKFAVSVSGNIQLDKDDAILVYTDGLEDIVGVERLGRTFAELASFFPGDSRAISRNIAEDVKEMQRETGFDVSFIVLTRKRN